MAYFEAHQLPLDWPAFLVDFQRHWPTDQDIYVDFVRDGLVGLGALRAGNPRWRRLTEVRAGAAKSVFHFDVQGQVAKSTHAGLPWLLFLRRQLGDRLHCWPFDGWAIPAGRSAMAEVYPALWKHAFPTEGRTPDQHDAYAVAAWLRQADLDDRLAGFLAPSLTPIDRTKAEIEGWILGVDRQHRRDSFDCGHPTLNDFHSPTQNRSKASNSASGCSHCGRPRCGPSCSNCQLDCCETRSPSSSKVT